MKQAFFIFCLLIIALLHANAAYAVTVTPTTVVASPSAELDRIQKIKDLVASRVAQLNLVDKRGVLGTVTETSTTQIVLQDVKKTRRIIDIDDITKFDDPDNKNFGISDVKKGNALSVVGLYNKDTKRLLARFVYTVTTPPAVFEGVIIDKDTKNYQLNATDSKGSKKLIDITASTKMYSFDADTGQVKTGFSKIPNGIRIFASGFMDTKVDNQQNATQVIVFPTLALSSGMKKYANPEPTVEVSLTKTLKVTATPTEQ